MSGPPMQALSGLVPALAEAINANRAWLSEIDGAIGDGDHGINMSKGFTQAAAALGDPPPPLPEALAALGNTLLEDVGGSMGPLYGTFFIDMADTLRGADALDGLRLSQALRAGLAGIQGLGDAKAGDKTMLDALIPAIEALDAALADGVDLSGAAAAMAQAAERGRDSTKEMVARVGRASRLGERSRGVLDAGAASCCLILRTMAERIAGAT